MVLGAPIIKLLTGSGRSSERGRSRLRIRNISPMRAIVSSCRLAILSFTACSKMTFIINSDGFSGKSVEGFITCSEAFSKWSSSRRCMNWSLGVEVGICSVRGHDSSPPLISSSDPLPGRMGGGAGDSAHTATAQVMKSPQTHGRSNCVVRGFRITGTKIPAIWKPPGDSPEN